MNNLEWLTIWFQSQCDGDWEDGYGISLNTMESCAWSLLISLNETSLENICFDSVKNEKSESDFLSCNIYDGRFRGLCSSNNVIEMLRIFRVWVERNSGEQFVHSSASLSDAVFLWLIDWYDQCNKKKLPSKNRIQIGTLSNPGWALDINLEGTSLETTPFEILKINYLDETDWIFCAKNENIFSANSGPFGILKLIEIFKNWADKK